MQNIIALDIGNTNTKILINKQDLQTISNQIIITGNFEQCLNLPQISNSVKIGICSVVSTELRTIIVQKLIKSIGIDQPEIILMQTHGVLAQALPLQHQHLAHIGCDRVLKTYHLTQLNKSMNHLSFGCGTAFSIEVVANGKFVDSAITPGLILQLESLNKKITRLPIIDNQKISHILAQQEFYTTEHSIVYGILNSFCSLIQSLTKKWNITTIIGSGGYANLIGEYLFKEYQIKSQVYANLETHVIQKIIKNNPSNI